MKSSDNPADLVWGLGLMLAVCCAPFAYYFFFLRPYTTTAQIEGFDWTRIIHVDLWQTVSENSWTLPPNARLRETKWQYRETVRVDDGTETRTEHYDCDTGSSYCGIGECCTREVEEDVYHYEDVYDYRYYYDIDKWVPSRTVATSGKGRSDPEPHWGELRLECNNVEEIGCERENHRVETYTVHFGWQDDGKKETYDYNVSREDWDLFDPSKKYELKINRITGNLANDPLRPDKE